MCGGRQNGQVLLLVAAASALFMIGAVGLVLDGAQLYVHRQMAQAAADAAAQAAAMSILGGTNTGANQFGSTAFTCAVGTDSRTPCLHARWNGFGLSGSADSVAVDFPTFVPGVPLADRGTEPAAVRVQVSRTVPTTFIRLFGPVSSRVGVAATAAVVATSSPVPILVLHPSLPNAFDLQGTPRIRICGGPQRSIQVNSKNAAAAHAGGSAQVDLSHAGPADTVGDCTSGTGGDFGVFGGPASTGIPSWLTPVGASEHYLQPAVPVSDPFAGVSPPVRPPAGTKSPLANGVSGCPAAPQKPCKLYSKGYYSAGIQVSNETAVFAPGVYYIDGGKNFGNAANGQMLMCSGCPADPVTGDGIMVYLTGGGHFAVGANSDAALVGSSPNSIYKGLLFFRDRAAPAAAHTLGGGGNISLQGAIYLTNTIMTASTYQTLSLNGGSGSSTLIRGQVIVSVLQLGGNGSITMQLDASNQLIVNQVALVK